MSVPSAGDLGPNAESAAPQIARILSYAALGSAAVYVATVIVRGNGAKLRELVARDGIAFVEFAIATGGLYLLATSPSVPGAIKTVVFIALISFLLSAGVSGRLVKIADSYASGNGLIASIVSELRK